MANSCSSSINEKNSLSTNETENSSIDEKINVIITLNGQRNKRQLTSKQYHQITDKLCEIEQIKCEEYFVSEQINRLNLEQEHLQNLLNILHTMDRNERMRKSQYRQRRLQKKTL